MPIGQVTQQCKIAAGLFWADYAVLGAQVQELEAAARQVLAQAGWALAMTLNIELFVIGGSVAQAGDLLLGPARETLPGYAFKTVSARVRVRASQLGEDGAILGAAWLARARSKLG